MRDADDQDEKAVVMDLIDHAIVTDPDPPRVIRAGQLAYARGPRVGLQLGYRSE